MTPAQEPAHHVDAKKTDLADRRAPKIRRASVYSFVEQWHNAIVTFAKRLYYRHAICSLCRV